MRVAALDVGEVRIGVAVTDELGMLSHPRPTIAASPPPAALRALCELVEAEEIQRFVIGLPLRLTGHEGIEARSARAFGARVQEATGCEVEFWDERLTTTQAHRFLMQAGHSSRKRRTRIDSAAACIVLQAWLDAQGLRR